MKSKSEIRSLSKAKREAFSNEYISQKSQQVIENLLKYAPNIKEKTVMSYMAIRGEINLENMQDHIFSKMYYPIIEHGKITPKSEDFKIGSFGIYEPTSGEINKNEIDICLIPGVAFSRNMQRIGFGRGYYDEFLHDFKGEKIGITYDALLNDWITPDEFDISMDTIITESEIITINNKK